MTTFLRLLHEDDKATSLEKALAGERDDLLFEVDPEEFAIVPGSPFAYWVSDRIRRLFEELPPVESEGRTVKQGLVTGDDFRFIRCWWEVANVNIMDGQNGPNWRDDLKLFQTWCKKRTFEHKDWVPFAKGGEYSPFYSDLHLVVNWAENGSEIKNLSDPESGKVASRPQNTDYYFRTGLTWPRRTTSGLSARVFQSGSIFADKGPCFFGLQLPECLAVMQSSIFQVFVELQLAAADAAARSYEVGVIQRSPMPKKFEPDLGQLAIEAVETLRYSDLNQELSHLFINSLIETKRNLIVKLQDKIDKEVQVAYGIETRSLAEIKLQAPEIIVDELESHEEIDLAKDDGFSPVSLLSYILGLAFGRWDIRYATGEKAAPELPDPFAPLPVCPPGQLQNEQGLPAGPGDVPEGYPVPIPWDGILVDDPNHPDDIVARSRQVMELIWHEKAADIEHEAAEILGVRELRDYFRKSAAVGFWPDHIKRYSKSRRKAPIYWQLATASGTYSVWLYYHRFTSDTFFKILNEYARPKLAHERQKLDRLRGDFGAQPARSQQKELEAQEGFIAELAEFADEIQRVAPLWRPNLNDGVIINFAPLWRLVPQNKPWQKECKACWDSLVKGEYDWSHLAMHLWPERVVPKCQTDASLAIAHGLEAEFWQKDARDRYQPKPAPECGWEVVVKKLVAERQSPAVKASVESLMEAPVSQSGGKGGRKRKGTA